MNIEVQLLATPSPYHSIPFLEAATSPSCSSHHLNTKQAWDSNSSWSCLSLPDSTAHICLRHFKFTRSQPQFWLWPLQCTLFHSPKLYHSHLPLSHDFTYKKKNQCASTKYLIPWNTCNFCPPSPLPAPVHFGQYFCPDSCTLDIFSLSPILPLDSFASPPLFKHLYGFHWI